MRMDVIDRHNDPWMFGIVAQPIGLGVFLRAIRGWLTNDSVGVKLNDHASIASDVNEDVWICDMGSSS
jgi:hypothetical protein